MNNTYIKTYLDKNYDADLLGGKGKNLSILSINGLPVPPWLCVLSKAYDIYVSLCFNDLEQLINGLNYDNIVYISEKAVALLDSRSFDEVLTKELYDALDKLDRNKMFAVRSSGCEEDNLNHSFAGLFETYLYIPFEEVPNYIKRCWQSIFSPRALAYLNKNRMSPLDIKMVVIVQEMVQSEKSGVLFQANPIGKLEEMVVVAGYGLGEGVVTNQTDTDTYYYNRLTKETTSHVVEKNNHFSFNSVIGKGISEKEVPAHLKNMPVLSESELRELLSISNSIEKLYNHYQDIEWAICGKNIYILQSRPITTIPTGELHLYDNSNIIESYPGISTPLTFTFVRKGYENNFRNSAIKVGIDKKIIAVENRSFSEMIENIDGRIYYKLTNWYNIFSLFPFVSRYLSNYLDEMIGVRKYNELKGYKISKVKTFLSAARIFSNMTYKFLRWDKYFNKYKRDFLDSYLRIRSLLEKDISNAELKKTCISYFDEVFSIINTPLINDMYLMILMGVTNSLIKSLSKNRDINSEELINGLLVGEKDMESVKPVRSLMEMAFIVRESPTLKEFLSNSVTSFDEMLMSKSFPEFYEKFSAHLEKFGDRGIGELKLESKTLRRKPHDFVKIVLNYSDSPLTTESMINKEQGLRQEAERQLAGLFEKNPIKKRIANFSINKLRYFIKNRECARMDRSRFFGLFRDIFLKIGSNWEAQGVLKENNDIFYLTYEEVLKHIDSPDKAWMQENILKRKAEQESYKLKNPIDRMWLKGNVNENFVPQKDSVKSSENGTLRGVGCCPGVVSEEAVVLHSPNETVNVKNKIIVAENTDPGWVYLMIGASGLIVEKGSLLSHTAIIGRELGIPTIVGVTNATTHIPSGSIIKMDGGLGTIELLIKEAEKSEQPV